MFPDFDETYFIEECERMSREHHENEVEESGRSRRIGVVSPWIRKDHTPSGCPLPMPSPINEKGLEGIKINP